MAWHAPSTGALIAAYSPAPRVRAASSGLTLADAMPVKLPVLPAQPCRAALCIGLGCAHSASTATARAAAADTLPHSCSPGRLLQRLRTLRPIVL